MTATTAPRTATSFDDWYSGWRCGAADDDTALRAAASLELLHAFALLQDDVMDGSSLRRVGSQAMSPSPDGIVAASSLATPCADDEHIDPAIRPALAHIAAACGQRAA